MKNFVRLDEFDNVVTLTKPLEAGSNVENFKTIEPVPAGHKLAAKAIKKGEAVYKYAQMIGFAATDIAIGAHVHTHNLAFRNVEVDYEFATNLRPAKPAKRQDHFMGYRRVNGSAGTRNTIAILTSVNCSATAARMIAAHFTEEKLAEFENVDGVNAYVHGTGCAMANGGEGFEALQRTLWGYARNPNVGGVVMAGLGCETMQLDWLVEAHGLTPGPLFQPMNIQDKGGIAKTVDWGIATVKEMLPLVNLAKREKCPASELMVALQCGGSDAWSGITANPAVGYACDLLVAQGGTGVLAETPEIYGAEHLLTARAIDRPTGEKLIERIKWWEDYTSRNHASMDNNPSPGNKKGGLTTILEKSLGAAAKGGTTPLVGVYQYAEQIIDKGFVFMDSPGYDPASVTGQIAGGCNLVCFTTGRGSAFGSKPAPTMKIATNSKMYQHMIDDMDIDAGPILSGEADVETIGEKIYEMWLKMASGQKSKSETQGLGDFEFVPWQIGAVM